MQRNEQFIDILLTHYSLLFVADINVALKYFRMRSSEDEL